MNITLNEINFEEILLSSTLSSQKLQVTLESGFHVVNFMKLLRLISAVCASYTRVTLISSYPLTMYGCIDFSVCPNLESLVLCVDQTDTQTAYYSFTGMPYLISIYLYESGEYIYFQTYSHIKIFDTPLLTSIKLTNACKIDRIDAPCLLSFEATACSLIKKIVAPKVNFINLSNRSEKTVIQDKSLQVLYQKKQVKENTNCNNLETQCLITSDTVKHSQIISVLENFRNARKNALRKK